MFTARPDAADAILSYYHSADAGQPDREEYGQELSGPSSPASCSPSSSDPNENDATYLTSPRPQPRVASPPAGSSTTGAAIRTSDTCQGGIAMESPRRSGQNQTERKMERGARSSDSGGGPRSDSRSGGRQFVAPPVQFPPVPQGAPVPSFQPSIPLPSDRGRSAFDNFGPKPIGHVPRKSSREVAIIGTTSFPSSASVLQHQSNSPSSTEFLRLPLFQIPQSRSPSPGISDISDSGCSSSRGRQRKDALAPVFSPVKEAKETPTPVRTPSISKPNHISDRLVGSLVINLPPQSPSPSPVFSSSHSSAQDLMSPRTNTSSPLTPSTALTSPATTPSPYLYYQPGLHATAGPLPPPPQAVFNVDSKGHPPPRPPRHSPIKRKDDLEAIKQVLQLPPHVTAALRSKCTPLPTEKQAESTSAQKPTTPVSPADSPSSNSHESFGSDPRPYHVREGAFPPSRICTLDPQPSNPLHEGNTASLPRDDSMDDLVAFVDLAIDDVGITKSCDVPPPTVVEPPRGHEKPNSGKGLEIRRTDNLKINLGRSFVPEQHHIDLDPSSPCSDESAAQSWVDADKTITLTEELVPPVPAKNDLPASDTRLSKNALNLKRYSSLPRPPSLMSLNRPSAGNKYLYGTPSPSVTHSVLPPKPPVRKMKSANPSALYFADVAVKRTALERSIGYAYKINELYNYDCGLGDWIAETRYKALHPHSSARRSNVNSLQGRRAPSTSSPSIAPRHISQSSTDSGVTFPRRADAYSATDLAPRISGDASPPNAPPPLPYPALAATPRGGPSRASTMIATSSSSSSRSAVSPSSVAKSPGSFFASLGRKASLKKEKSLTPPSLAKTLSRSPPRNGTEQSTPRPANLPPVTQSVPGGPRAPPSRMQRSQTIIVPSQNSVNGTSPQRSSTMARRPSLFGARGSAQKENSSISEAEFGRQVDKLAALLPKADRNVLAIYLRQTGQDILAIGQYLEDEKNGTLRYA